MQYSDKYEIDSLKKIAKDVFGISFRKISREGSEANVVAIQSEDYLLSQRLDSRTYFIQDNRYGAGKKLGYLDAPDANYLKLSHNILRNLGIKSTEIVNETVLWEKTQTARSDEGTGEKRIEDIKEGKKFVKISRKIDNNIPVWSSNLIVGFTKEKRVGFMQCHWPEIPKHVINEANRLVFKLKEGWKPPMQEGEKVEEVEAGIIHSPALGFLMDIFPAIRVIYGSADESFGKKKVLYLDRHGKSIPIPRQGELPYKEKQERPKR